MLRSRYIEREPAERKVKVIASHPMLYPVIGFVILILLGGVLLWLPFSTHRGISFVDAIFTSTSASCVTGLTVVDTGGVFTRTGQAILIVLMQVGGIGVMVLSTLFMLVSRAKMGFGQHSAFMSSYTSDETISPMLVLKNVFIVTVIIEAIGAAILYTQFSDLPTGARVFYSVFHAVSAFCNAGFGLYSDSMVSFQLNPVVNFTLVILIVAGGFGFLTLGEVFTFRKGEGMARRWGLHTRLVVIVTPLLILSGMGFFALMEWDNSLNGLGWFHKLLASLFHSVSARTAGFNSVDVSALAAPTLFALIILMFIGANPGSCGGGIKTTTATLIGLLGFNRFWGREKTVVMSRTVPEETVDRAVRIFVLSIVVIAIAVMALSITEAGHLSAREGQTTFLTLLFETVSAFATCGLSMNFSPDLTVAGKVIIALVMFIGRLGPLVLVQAVVRHSQEQSYFASENVMVG